MALTPSDQKYIENIITFWFETISPEQWFTKSAEFDQQLREANPGKAQKRTTEWI